MCSIHDLIVSQEVASYVVVVAVVLLVAALLLVVAAGFAMEVVVSGTAPIWESLFVVDDEG